MTTTGLKWKNQLQNLKLHFTQSCGHCVVLGLTPAPAKPHAKSLPDSLLTGVRVWVVPVPGHASIFPSVCLDWRRGTEHSLSLNVSKISKNSVKVES